MISNKQSRKDIFKTTETLNLERPFFAFRTQGLPGRKPGQDGALPLLQLSPAALPLHSSTRGV